MNKSKNIQLSKEDILRSLSETPKIIAPNIKGMNWTNGVLDGFNEIPIHETPNIKAILEILEPTTVPIANSSLAFKTDDIPTNISGADVPSATIVKPIVSSLRPSFLAIKDEFSTNLSAPQIKTVKETARALKWNKNIAYSITLR